MMFKAQRAGGGNVYKLAMMGVVVTLGAMPASAQVFDVTQVSGFCSEALGFGQKFGGEKVENPGRSSSAFGNRRTFDPEADFLPFTNFEAGFTPKSKALHSIEATAFYKNAAEAIAAFDAIETALSASDQFDFVEVGDREQAASGFVGQKVSYFLQPETEPPTGLRMDLRLYARVQNDSTVVLDCTEQAIFRRAEREAF